MSTEGGLTRLPTLPAIAVEGIIPAGTAGLVGPNPVPQRMITSPGLAGTVVLPAKVPFLTAQLKSWRVATAALPGQRKNAGLAVWELTVAGAPAPPVAVVTLTDIVPVPA